MTNDSLVTELAFQLRGGHAHAPLDQVVKNVPFAKQGEKAQGVPYSLWQLLEHIRLALEDMVEFSDNANGHYKEKKWPDDYWPKSPAPPSKEAWERSAQTVRDEIEKMVQLISAPSADLFKPFPWGDGQTLFKEACQIIDHNAYHLGEMVAVRRLLQIW